MENGSDNGGNTHLDIIGTCLNVTEKSFMETLYKFSIDKDKCTHGIFMVFIV